MLRRQLFEVLSLQWIGRCNVSQRARSPEQFTAAEPGEAGLIADRHHTPPTRSAATIMLQLLDITAFNVPSSLSEMLFSIRSATRE